MAEEFSNPLAPDQYDDHVNKEQPLTNADFRKFLTAPSQRSERSASDKQRKLSESDYNPEQHESAAEKRRKKKTMYAKLKKQEMERQAELQKKYRDRAKERREGKGDYADTELINTTANYKTVGPTLEADHMSAEKRRQVIQESKYLGGDMAHTHLVKGLDYALLQKVRAEITTKEKENEEILDKVLEEDVENIQQNEVLTFKTRMAKNVHRIIFQPHMKQRNELFLPGRMAYVFELDNEYADTDIPTTLLRSKADCPTMESQTTLSTNDIVINKLTQILSYLRQGARDKHRRKKDKKVKGDGEKSHKRPIEADLSIFDDAGEYVPNLKKSKSRAGRDAGSYFEKPKMEDDDVIESKKAVAESVGSFVKSVSQKYPNTAPKEDPIQKQVKKEKSKGISLMGASEAVPDSYMECYPSMQYNLGGIGDDSDDEVDYSKMDQGNKKGPVGRWDFDTQEEYSSYMSQKEALPKAAFQYGIKMGGGRKTRRTKEQNEKQKLNRELQQINSIIEKRKTK